MSMEDTAASGGIAPKDGAAIDSRSILSNRVLFILALAGFGVSIYLTLAHLGAAGLVCGRTGGCHAVAEDAAAKGLGIPLLRGIPTAAFGAAMYMALAALSMVRASSGGRGIPLAAQWLISGVGVVVSGWLTYREAFVINEWCRWCVISAVLITLFFVTASVERAAARE